MKLKMKQTLAFNNQMNASLHLLKMSDEDIELIIKEFIPSYRSSYHYTPDIEIYQDIVSEDIHLIDEILYQVGTSPHQFDINCVEYLVSELDSNGYFRVTLEELIHNSIYSDNDIKYHLSHLRAMEPHGCFSFSLSDCLQLQCAQNNSEISKIAYRVCDCLEAVAASDYDYIMELCNIDYDTVISCISYIKDLNPKPASKYASNSKPLIAELEITVVDKHITINSLNENWNIQSLVDELNDTSEDLKKQREHLNSFLSYLEKRNITLVQVATAMSEIHSDFFLNDGKLVRCTLEMIARKTGLSTSTISRAISNKSCLFENKYYPLKYFLVSSGSKEVSGDQIKSYILNYISEEDIATPLSDSSIQALLVEDKIEVSRRLITKYREQLNIPNSIRRKRNYQDGMKKM